MKLNSLCIEVGSEYRVFTDHRDPNSVEVCLNSNSLVEGTLRGNYLDIDGVGEFTVSRLRRGERTYVQIEDVR